MKNFFPAPNVSRLAIILGLLLSLGLSPVPASAQFGHALDERTNLLQFEINIVDGSLKPDGLAQVPGIQTLFTNNLSAIPATLTTLVKLMQLIDTNANFVIEPAIKNVRIENLQFRSHANSKIYAVVLETLYAFSTASQNKFVVRQSMETLFILGYNSIVQPEEPAPPKPSFDVYNLSTYFMLTGLAGDEKTERNKIDQLQNLINETTANLSDGSPGGTNEVRLRFHPGTKLVIVFGNNPAREAAKKIITALNQTPFGTNNEPPK